VESKTEAVQIEKMITRACRTRNYSVLDDQSREACMRMFENQKWELPDDLKHKARSPREELTLWRAVEIFLKYPGIRESRDRWRKEYAINRLLYFFGKDFPIRELWIPQIKEYRIQRLKDGAAPTTVNREMACLSKIFQVLIELEHLNVNPVRMVKRLSTKSGEREAYVSWKDFHRIVDACPAWFRAIAMTAYYTGMRRGEILGLTRNQVKLSQRMIVLGSKDTKEARAKRIPIHRNLIPILEEALKVTCLQTDKVFLLHDEKGVRPLKLETFKNVWPRGCASLKMEKPWPRFHDLRHTWKTNARRSGMDGEIRESILGHWSKEKSVSERYGRISNQELIDAIDSMNFDYGPTEIVVSR
jgi:integrase